MTELKAGNDLLELGSAHEKPDYLSTDDLAGHGLIVDGKTARFAGSQQKAYVFNKTSLNLLIDRKVKEENG